MLSYANLSAYLRFLPEILRHPTQRKHLLRWLVSLHGNYPLRTRQPWLVFDAVRYLDSLNLKGARVFEYGSGGSTFYWLDRNAVVVSVEHEASWFALLQQDLGWLPSLDYRLVPPEVSDGRDTIEDPADPLSYVADRKRFRGLVFRSYVCQIDAYPDSYFDIVLIDGRARPSCIKHSPVKVKVGGMIILDNSDRAYYLAKTSGLLGNFKRRAFSGVAAASMRMSKTDFFIRKG